MPADIPADTKEQPGPFDAFETAKPGEPIFTLQGGDPLAAGLVLLWAKHARRRALALRDENPGSREAHELLLRATSAEGVAWDMQSYCKGHAVEEVQEREEGEDAQAALDRHDLLRRSARRLHNSLAEANDVAEAIEGLEGFENVTVAIRAASTALHASATALEPRRSR